MDLATGITEVIIIITEAIIMAEAAIMVERTPLVLPLTKATVGALNRVLLKTMCAANPGKVHLH